MTEPGDDITFDVVVENTSKVDEVTIGMLTDKIGATGTRTSICADKLPATLAPTEKLTCSFEVPVSGRPGDMVTDIVEASGTDDDGLGVEGSDTETVTGTDDDRGKPDDSAAAVVTYVDVKPRIVVTKRANVASVPETGGEVTFTVRVENPGLEAVTLTELNDSVFGNLDGTGDCKVRTPIDPGGTYTCTFTKRLSGDDMDTTTEHRNTVTATAEDDDDNTVKSSASADVDLTDVKPTIEVTKTANAGVLSASGGPVVFTVVVTNRTAEPTTVSGLVDDVFGDIGGLDRSSASGLEAGAIAWTITADTCSNGNVLATLGSTYRCTITATLSLAPGATAVPTHRNVVTAVGSDDDGNTDDGTANTQVRFQWRGRTPGYWKNRLANWDDAPPSETICKVNGVDVYPTTSVSAVFSVPVSYLSPGGILDLNGDGRADTMSDALGYRGGSNLFGGLQILLRAGVAGLLNECRFGDDYPAAATPASLVTSVNTAVATRERAKMVALADTVDRWNNGIH